MCLSFSYCCFFEKLNFTTQTKKQQHSRGFGKIIKKPVGLSRSVLKEFLK